MKGYIKLYRQIADNPIFQDSDMFKLWIYCLLKASHKKHEVMVERQTVQLSPGEFVTGRFALAEDFNKGVKKSKQVNDRTLWRWMKTLEKWQMLSIKPTNKYSIVTIENWEFYQQQDRTNEHQNDHQMSSSCPSNDHQMSTNKNVKNEKNEKKIDDNDDWLFDDSDYPEITEIQNMFIQQANRFPSANDLYLISQAVDNFPMETIRQGISGAFEYKRSQGEQIRSFSYCYKAIEGLHRKKTAGGKRYAKPDATRGNVHGRNQTPDPVDKAATNPIWNLVQEV